MNRLVIIGAGGQGKVIADIAIKNGYSDICFVDDNAVGNCMGFPIIGTCKCIESMNDGTTDFIIAIGNNHVRKKVAESYDVVWVTLIDPSAQIASDIIIGTGTVIMAGAVVNVSARIGQHCIINTGTIVEHDNVINDYVHLSPRAVLGGTVQIGELTHVGIGATIRNNIDICHECTIGAGAVVVKPIAEPGVYIGVPAQKIECTGQGSGTHERIDRCRVLGQYSRSSNI